MKLNFKSDSHREYELDIKIKRLEDLSKNTCFCLGGLTAVNLYSILDGSINIFSIGLTTVILATEFVKIKWIKKED